MTTAFIKLLAISAKGEEEYLVDFLKKHELDISQEKLNKINEYIDNFYNDFNEDKTKKEEMQREDIASVVYTFISAAIEKTFSDFNISLEKPMSWTKRKMKVHKSKATEALEKNIEHSFTELEEMLERIKQDLEENNQKLEEPLQEEKVDDQKDAT
jgi:flagellar capping protein FliD